MPITAITNIECVAYLDLTRQSIKMIDDEDNPYLWIVNYCLCKGINQLHTLTKPLALLIGDYKFIIYPSIAYSIEVFRGNVLIGQLMIDDYWWHDKDVHLFKSQVIDELVKHLDYLLDLYNSLNPQSNESNSRTDDKDRHPSNT